MKLFRTSIAVISFVAASPCLAQATPKSIVDSTMADLKAGDVKTIVENLIAKAPLIAVGPTEKTNLINSLDTILTSYGKVEGWELISTRDASDRFIQQTYIVFLERYAMKFTLKFYQRKEGWTLTAFEFNDQLDELLAAQDLENIKQSLRD